MNRKIYFPGTAATRPLSGVVVLSLLGFGASALGLATPLLHDGPETLYTIQRTTKVGDTDRYKLAFHATINADPQFSAKDLDLSINLKYKEIAKEVATDGTATLADTPEQVMLRTATMEQDVTPIMPVVTQSVDKQGKLLDIKADTTNVPVASAGTFFINAMARTQAAFYPPRPVKIGDTWKWDDGHPIKVNTQTITSSSAASFIGKETLNGIDTVKVKAIQDSEVTTVSVRTGTRVEKIHFEGTGNIDPKDGKFVKLVGTITSTGVFRKSDFALTRILGEEKPDPKPATDTKAAGTKPSSN